MSITTSKFQLNQLTPYVCFLQDLNFTRNPPPPPQHTHTSDPINTISIGIFLHMECCVSKGCVEFMSVEFFESILSHSLSISLQRGLEIKVYMEQCNLIKFRTWPTEYLKWTLDFHNTVTDPGILVQSGFCFCERLDADPLFQRSDTDSKLL